jgi:hypothetical protein
MNAEAAKLAAKKKRENDTASIPARAYSRIQDRATMGRNFLLCRSNKQACTQLKSDGFGCILFFNIALIWW